MGIPHVSEVTVALIPNDSLDSLSHQVVVEVDHFDERKAINYWCFKNIGKHKTDWVVIKMNDLVGCSRTITYGFRQAEPATLFALRWA